jgi:hypothetical protein
MVPPDAPAAPRYTISSLLFSLMIAVLVFANWAGRSETAGLWYASCTRAEVVFSDRRRAAAGDRALAVVRIFPALPGWPPSSRRLVVGLLLPGTSFARLRRPGTAGCA